MISPNTSNDNPEMRIDTVETELREGLENSRLIVRASRTLIALAECETAAGDDQREQAAAD